MDDLTAGEVLPHVSAVHIRLTAPPIQALGGTAEYCASRKSREPNLSMCFSQSFGGYYVWHRDQVSYHDFTELHRQTK